MRDLVLEVWRTLTHTKMWKWIFLVALAASLAGITRTIPSLDPHYVQEARVWMHDATATAQTVILTDLAILEKGYTAMNIPAYLKSVHDHLAHWLFYPAPILALAMVLAELIRGIRDLTEHLRRSSRDAQAGTTGRNADWKRWAAGLAVALPALIAVLYYGTHATMA
jgi:hypothetical protein